MSVTAATIPRPASGWSILWAILMIVAGLFALALPWAATFGAVLVIGWLLVFSSVFQALHAFQAQGVGSILWKLLVALLYLGVGFYFITHPVLGMAALTLGIAIFFLVEGIADLVTYFKERKSPGSGWILFDGIVTLVLGLLIWRHWPSSALWAVGVLLGISMLLTGITRLMLTLAVRRLRAAPAV
ncbi:MAG: HdeD family acid-resistance protein [Acidobacteriota bacterium]